MQSFKAADSALAGAGAGAALLSRHVIKLIDINNLEHMNVNILSKVFGNSQARTPACKFLLIYNFY